MTTHPPQLTKNNPTVLTRTARFDTATVDDATRTVELAISSEYEVKGWGNDCEVLIHEAKAIRLDRLKNKAALLFNHDRDELIGVVLSPVLDAKNKVLRVTARFSNSEEGQKRFLQVQEGVLCHVSIGYAIHAFNTTEEGGSTCYNVIDWEPLEVSLVTVPADPTVGVGRSFAENTTENPFKDVLTRSSNPPHDEPNKGEPPMTTLTTEQKTQIRNLGTEHQLEREALDAIVADTTPEEFTRTALGLVAKRQAAPTAPPAGGVASRIDGINLVAREFGHRDVAAAYIAEGKTVEEFESYVRDQAKHSAPTQPASGGYFIAGNEPPAYDLGNAFRALTTGEWGNAKREHEISLAGMEQYSVPQTRQSSLFIPFSELHKMRGLSLGLDSGAKGGSTVQTQYTGSFIDVLRAKMVLPSLGATLFTGLEGNGNLSIPRVTSQLALAWTGEGSDYTESDITFDSVVLSPKKATCFVPITQELLMQSSISLDSYVQNALATSIGLGVQQAAINGNGVAKPTGILNTSGIGSLALGANGGAASWNMMVDLETLINSNDADEGNLAYWTNPKVRGALKKTFFNGTSSMPIIDNQKICNGFKVYSNTQIPSNLTKGTSSGNCSAMIFGNFADLYMGMWGGINILYNPYSEDTKGRVRYTANMLLDVQVARPKSFAVCADITTA